MSFLLRASADQAHFYQTCLTQKCIKLRNTSDLAFLKVLEILKDSPFCEYKHTSAVTGPDDASQIYLQNRELWLLGSTPVMLILHVRKEQHVHWDLFQHPLTDTVSS